MISSWCKAINTLANAFELAHHNLLILKKYKEWYIMMNMK